MKQAAQGGISGLRDEGAGNPQDRIRKVERGGRRAALVGDHDLRALPRQAQHGVDEIGAERAVDPRDPQDDAVARRLRHRLLARELRASIGAERAGRIVLPAGPADRSVEHIVGRQMQERHAEPAGGRRDRPCPRAVHRHRHVRLAFRPVDGRIGGGIEDGIRAGGGERRQDAARMLQVERRASQRHGDDRVRRRPLQDGAGHLSAAPDDGHAHAITSSVEAMREIGQTRVPLVPSDMTASSRPTGQAIPSAGSSKASPTSHSGA